MAHQRRGGRKGRNTFAKIFLYMMLEVGALAGVPIRPQEVEELTRMIAGTQVVHVVRREDDGEPP